MSFEACRNLEDKRNESFSRKYRIVKRIESMQPTKIKQRKTQDRDEIDSIFKSLSHALTCSL